MYKQLKKDQGFTIIEVMIVLAIAGLILLIVFLAVPALQRTARNTTIKNDASAIAGGVTEFESNNSGSLPNNAAAVTGPTLTLTNSTLAAPLTATVKINGSTNVAFPAAAPAATLTSSQIDVVWAAACPGNTASSRSVAIYYGIETASGGGGNGCISS